MSKLRVMTIVGTRPEIIRLSRLIAKLEEIADHTLVHTGQNHDPNLSAVFFDDLGIRQPDEYLEVDASSMGSVIGDTIRKTELALKQYQPDAVMILGDTNSAMAAIVAERLHIPVYHMEAGNRSFDANVPEELNRRLVDHVATFNLPYNDFSLRNLLDEGVQPRFIQKTGSPIREVYEHYRERVQASDVLGRLNLEPEGYMLASIHRQENVDNPERLAIVMDSLSRVSSHFGKPVLLSTHPRTRKQLDLNKVVVPDSVRLHPPLNYSDYNKLQLKAYCVISDSGTISEESSIAGFPGVSMRSSIERPEALETGATILAGIGFESLSRAISFARRPREPRLPQGYEVSDFSDRVISFLLSTVHLYKEWKSIR
jgi:UDP-N-acetylglucosamine 2-epimerase (non-hydrolysing)